MHQIHFSLSTEPSSTPLNQTDESRLLKYLISRSQAHGVYTRPVLDPSKSVAVKFGLRLIRVDINESRNIMNTGAWVRQVMFYNLRHELRKPWFYRRHFQMHFLVFNRVGNGLQYTGRQAIVIINLRVIYLSQCSWRCIFSHDTNLVCTRKHRASATKKQTNLIWSCCFVVVSRSGGQDGKRTVPLKRGQILLLNNESLLL